MKYYNLKNKEIRIETGQYPVGGANYIVVKEAHETVCIASVNLPDQNIPLDKVAIKDYSENEGILNDLIELGVISQPVRYVNLGFAAIPICDLLKKSL